jgi:hypothetical protein
MEPSQRANLEHEPGTSQARFPSGRLALRKGPTALRPGPALAFKAAAQALSQLSECERRLSEMVVLFPQPTDLLPAFFQI